MAELEKVIKGLSICGRDNPDCQNCPYYGEQGDGFGCETIMQRDALTLLKAKEPKPPRFTVAYDKIFYGCDNCGKSLVVMANSEGLVLQKYAPKYCSECGQAVKWE